MEKHIAIYLAGNIKKGHENESQVFWTQSDMDLLQNGLSPRKLTFLNPATRTDDLSDQKSVFGRDMTQVFLADVVIVDARERRGLGVGAEMMWAKMNTIPVLTLAPKNTHYQKEKVHLLDVLVTDWTHPFVESLSDAVLETLEEAVSWLLAWEEGKEQVKGSKSVHEAMHHYQKTQLKHDLPMQQLIACNSALQEKLISQESLKVPH